MRINILASLAGVSCLAQVPVPFPPVATFQTTPAGRTSGGAFVDIDRDGDMDLITAEGNDVVRQSIAVYLNSGSGVFPVNPNWQSADIDYHGRLDVGDVNGDGWTDVAVSVFLGAGGVSTPGHVKLYLNNQGTLANLPSWTSGDQFHSFACALGDADNDGDLDLAVACGEPYNGSHTADRVYFNQNGTLQSLPGWTSSSPGFSLDAVWCDIDGDGFIDLVTGGIRCPTKLYRNNAGVLSTTPVWISTDGGTHQGSVMVACGDIDGDSLPDLVTSNNSTFNGTGKFRCYRNLGTTFTATPWWESQYGGNVSCVGLIDFDLDGDLDLIGGKWSGRTSVYRNVGGVLSTAPAWETTATAAPDDVFFGDMDGDGLRVTTGESKIVNGAVTRFGFAHGNVQSLQQVIADGISLPPSGFAFHRERGELTLTHAPQSSLVLDYTWSEAVDFGLPGWESNRGSYVFKRTPLLDLTMSPPALPSYSAGTLITWTETLANTADNWQPFFYESQLVFPNSILTFTMNQGFVMMPPGLVLANWPLAISVPSPMPPALLGGYTYRVSASGPTGTIMSSRSFTVQLH